MNSPNGGAPNGGRTRNIPDQPKVKGLIKDEKERAQGAEMIIMLNDGEIRILQMRPTDMLGVCIGEAKSRPYQSPKLNLRRSKENKSPRHAPPI